MAFTEGFVSDLVGRPATLGNEPVGKVVDFLVGKPDAVFPQVDGLVIKTAQGLRFAPIESVADVEPRGSVVLTLAPQEPAPPEQEELYLVADLLDKQIVDVDGRKVVRINDIELANTGGRLRVVAADVGIAGLLRRLGLRSFGRRWLARFSNVPRSMIAWDSVAPIREANPFQVRLSVKQNRLARLHPSELAEIIGDLSSREALAVVGQLDDETAADAFEHLDAETRKSLIGDIGTERAADIIEEMDADDAADLLAEMDAYTAGELRELVKYPEDSAGGLMTTDYVWIYPHRTTEATIRKIREIAPVSEFIYYLYVLDREDHLLGAVSLRALLLALPTAFIDRIMQTDLITVAPDMPAVDVASTIAKYDLLAVPVVDDAGKMLGIVTVDDAIDAIMPDEVVKKLPRVRRHHPRRGVA